MFIFTTIYFFPITQYKDTSYQGHGNYLSGRSNNVSRWEGGLEVGFFLLCEGNPKSIIWLLFPSVLLVLYLLPCILIVLVNLWDSFNSICCVVRYMGPVDRGESNSLQNITTREEEEPPTQHCSLLLKAEGVKKQSCQANLQV